MAENAPPATSATPNGAGTSATATNTGTSNSNGAGAGTTAAAATATVPEQNGNNRGLPYYEKLRRDLRDTLQKKRLMDKSMAQLEDQIFRYEQNYLEETTAGNIIKGFDNYIKGSSNTAGLSAGGLTLTGSSIGTARRKAQVSDVDRVFSRSSASYLRDSPAPSSAQTTPSHAPTPSSTTNGPTSKSSNGDVSSAVKSSSSKNNKKKSGGSSNKDKNNDEDLEENGDKPPTKRLKISYGRD
ncbi:hypothetical protein ASPWEDRAFT_41896 [Aspergillus wentii DTO 134E9]|uniref:Chromatin modification-related protein EAF6 n=1 Tax=Aspergillus wentii DTO 134E9 TaxID=1073089 RepID=A0A1L9RGL8_ASPWE|nr:uncharacterized protein ASPWEDRAFT_41896 [Aspergillus wentii DTO 134E9]OJJ33997.1 hypothetical protein ASPWEDRAFT_41896 [Aspergillus wentii DTO 134E9]